MQKMCIMHITLVIVLVGVGAATMLGFGWIGNQGRDLIDWFSRGDGLD
jgi:hypothetical protein